MCGVPEIAGFPSDRKVCKREKGPKSRTLTDFWNASDSAFDDDNDRADCRSEGSQSFTYYGEDDIDEKFSPVTSDRSAQMNKTAENMKPVKVKNLLSQGDDGFGRKNRMMSEDSGALSARACFDLCDSVDHASLPALFCHWCGRRLANSRPSVETLDMSSEVDSIDTDACFHLKQNRSMRATLSDVTEENRFGSSSRQISEEDAAVRVSFSDGAAVLHDNSCNTSSSSGVPEYLSGEHELASPRSASGQSRIFHYVAAVAFNGVMAYWTFSVLKLSAARTESGPAARRMLLVSLPFWAACTSQLLRATGAHPSR